MKLELVLKKELLQSGCELAPEDATQRGDGQEELSRGGDPSGTVGCKTARRNNVMDVGMMVKVLSPSVEQAKKPDVGTQMFRVAGEFEQRRCTSSEQQIVMGHSSISVSQRYVHPTPTTLENAFLALERASQEFEQKGLGVTTIFTTVESTAEGKIQ